jgi:PadR family transcriptional regulator AphA
MAKRTNATRFLILGLLREGPLSGYDIRRLTKLRFRLFWSESFGQIYPALNRLEKEGLVKSGREDKGGRKRLVYELAPAGKREFESWLPRSAAVETMRYELLLKLYFSTPGDGTALRPQLAAFRQRALASLADLKRAHEDLSAGPEQHPNHRSILAVIRLGLAVYRTFADWARETDRLFPSAKPRKRKE